MVTAFLIGSAGLYLCLKYGLLMRAKPDLLRTLVVVGMPIGISFWLLATFLDTPAEEISVAVIILSALPILSRHFPTSLTSVCMFTAGAIFAYHHKIIESAISFAFGFLIISYWLLHNNRYNLRLYTTRIK